MTILNNNLISEISSYRVLNADFAWLLRRCSNRIFFLGHEVSPSGVELSKRSFDRMRARFHRLYEQGAIKLRLVKYVKNWIKWARSGVSHDIEKLKLKTTQILQNTFHVQVPLKSS